MPNPLDNATCADAYTDAATIGPVWNSNGGYFIVTAQDVFMQIGYQEKGVHQVSWMPEAHVPTGNGTLYKGTVSIRFRNYTAGQNATVSGQLATANQPVFTVGAGGISSPTASTMITGSVSATGGVVGGTGFTVVKGSSGIYTVNFNTAFAVAPDVQATIVENNSGLGITVNTITTASFGVRTDTTATPTNHAFNFLAVPMA